MFQELAEFFRLYVVPGLLAAAIGYLLGSISFSIIITRLFERKADIRTMGSGNAGFTNVLRSVGKLPAVLTFIGDFGKGVLAVLLGRLMFQCFSEAGAASYMELQYGAYLAGVACLFGHLFPCYFGFKGGKGVLTTAAMMLLIDWRVFLIEIVIFLIIFLLTKIISLSSIIAALLYPISTFCVVFFGDYLPNQNVQTHPVNLSYVIITTVITACVAAVVVVKHHSNIRRILHGEEKKITSKKRS